MTGEGEHSNTSVVQMRDQRFSKHTLITISLSRKYTNKREFRAILLQNLSLNKLFWGTYLMELEKRTLISP